MKKLIAIFSALTLLGSALAEEPTILPTFFETFNPEDVTIQSVGNGESWISFAEGQYGTMNPGKPAIPTKSFAVRLPADEEVVGCKVTLGETILLAEDITPVCEQRPVPGIDENSEPTPHDASAYASADPYPAERCAYVATSLMRGIRIASFRLAPVWYVAAEKKLYLAKSVKVEIETRPVYLPLGASAAPMPSSDLFETAANSMVINPSEIYYPKAVSPGGTGCQYLVITSNSFVSAAQKLADFRASFNGVTAAVVDTTTINSGYSGTDLAEKIRTCIRWHVENRGTEYVVLAGDETVVPARMAKLDASLYASATPQDLVTPSDIYYSDLDAGWTKDNSDATYHSWSCDSSSSGLAPDVIVGRLPMRNVSQLNGYIAKVIHYERDTTDDSDVVRKNLFGGYTCWTELYRKAGGWEEHDVASSPYSVTKSSVTSLPETFNDGLREVVDRTAVGSLAADTEVWGRRLNHSYHRDRYPCFRTSFFYNSGTSWDESTSTNSQQTVEFMQATLNRGYHQLFFDGHGSFNGWGIGGTFVYDGSTMSGLKAHYTGNDAARLNGRVDFIYTAACNTGAFDLAEPCLSEGFLRAPGGAIGYIGCSRYGWGRQMGASWGVSGTAAGISTDFAREFWKRLFDNKDRTLGAAFANHKNAMVLNTSVSPSYNKWLQLGINLQGDPLATYHLPTTAETRTSDKPGLVTLLRDAPIVTTAGSATIKLAADEIPAGNAATVVLEYSNNSGFSSSTSVTVASSLARQDELVGTISGLSANTTYYVRGKITVNGQTNLSPFSLSFTTKAAGTATVAGRVEGTDGRGVAGITVTAVAAGNATVATTTTDAGGNYQLAVPSGWSGTIVLSSTSGQISGSPSKPVATGSNALVTLDFTVAGANYFVKQNATGIGDGSSWANAFTTLAAAFSAAPAGSVIWVAEGVYTPDTTQFGRDSHFAPPAYVSVYGGFAGNETSLAARDWIAHPTVLSADIGTKGTQTDNCYHLVRYNKGVLLDGFGLTGAYLSTTARSSGYEDNYGAVVGSPLSNPAPELNSVYPLEAPDDVMILDHCAITNNTVPLRNGSGYGDLGGQSAKVLVGLRNTFVADNNVSGSHLFAGANLENCTLTRNHSSASGLCNCYVRNCLYLGNQKDFTGSGEPSTTSGTSWQGENFFIYFYTPRASVGSGYFMADSYYIRSDSNLGITGGILASGSNPAGWITDEETGFTCALAADSAAADRGVVLGWMTDDTLDYLGHPRVYGSAPDLGCCEAFESTTPPVVSPSGSVSSSSVSFTTATVTAAITDLGSEASQSDVMVSLIVSPNSDYSSPVFSGCATTKTLTGLSPNTTYYVKATFTGANSGATTSTTTFKTSAYTAPAVPTVSIGSITYSSAVATVTLGEWGDGASSGTVDVKLLSASNQLLTTKSGSAGGAFTFDGLDPETNYKVVVTVTAAVTGLSTSSAAQSFTTDAAPVVVPPSGTVSSGSVSFTTATVTAAITDLGDETSQSDVTVSLIVSSNSDYSSPVFSGNAMTKTLTGLSPNTTYYVKATFTGANSGATTSTATFKTSAYTAPAVPTVNIGSITYSSAVATVTLGAWGAGASSGTVDVKLLSASDQLLTTKSGSAGGTFTFDGLDPETNYKVVVTVTAAVTGLSTSSSAQTFTTMAAPDITLSAATAAVSEDGTNATLAVTVTGCNIDDASLTLTLNGATKKTWNAISAGDYSFTVTVAPGSTNAFVFTASGGGVTRTAQGSFVATTYVGWFDVQFEAAGFQAGENWLATSTDASGGTFTADETVSSELVKGIDRSYVTPLEGSSGAIRYAPSHPSETGADVRLEGWVQVDSSTSCPEAPNTMKAGFCFQNGIPYGYGNSTWNAIGATALPEKSWVRYAIEFDYAGEDAPRVRYAIGAETSVWASVSVATRNVTSLGIANGTFGNFKAGYYSFSSGETIELVRPEFAEGGAGVSLAGGTFSLTVSNPVEGAYYTVFSSETLDGTFTAEYPSVQYDGSTLVLPVDATPSAKFVRIHISREPYAAGTPEP